MSKILEKEKELNVFLISFQLKSLKMRSTSWAVAPHNAAGCQRGT